MRLTLRQARVVIEDGRQHYNQERPHSSLGVINVKYFSGLATIKIPDLGFVVHPVFVGMEHAVEMLGNNGRSGNGSVVRLLLDGVQ